MKRAVDRFSVFFAAMVIFVGLFGSVNAQQKNERQVRDLIRSLNSQVDNFQFTVEDDMHRNSADQQEIAELSASLANLQLRLTAFEDNLTERRENRDDVNEIVNAAQDVDGFFKREQPSPKVSQQWSDIKSTIGRLSANYGITPNWDGKASASSSSNRGNRPST